MHTFLCIDLLPFAHAPFTQYDCIYQGPFQAGIFGDLPTYLKVTLRWHGYCSKFIMGRNQKAKMDRHLPKVQKTASDTAEIINVAIKCTAFVLRRAQELPQDKQKPMLAIVKDLISMEADEKGLST
jgi:hypothetical protein